MHRGRHRGYGWNNGFAYGIPAYSVLPEGVGGDTCACKDSLKSQVSGLSGIESWVKENPILSLIGVFALGMIVSKKKGLF